MNEAMQVLRVGGGRELRIYEAGNEVGPVILVHRGTPGSGNLYGHWIEDATARGARLIGFDRPGYGGSTPRPDRRVADVAEDVASLAAALGLERISMWGISGGGPHVLACAALLPELVASAAVLASPTPYQAQGLDWTAGMGESNIAEFEAALAGRKAVTAFIENLAPELLSTDADALYNSLKSLLCAADAAVLNQEYAKFLVHSIGVGIGERRDGWIDDDLAFTRDWGFSLADIRVPVLLLHGQQDRFVPFAHGVWLAEHIPKVDSRLLPEDGHLTLSAHRISEVHAWLMEHRK